MLSRRPDRNHLSGWRAGRLGLVRSMWLQWSPRASTPTAMSSSSTNAALFMRIHCSPVPRSISSRTTPSISPCRQRRQPPWIQPPTRPAGIGWPRRVSIWLRTTPPRMPPTSPTYGPPWGSTAGMSTEFPTGPDSPCHCCGTTRKESRAWFWIRCPRRSTTLWTPGGRHRPARSRRSLPRAKPNPPAPPPIRTSPRTSRTPSIGSIRLRSSCRPRTPLVPRSR